LGAAAAVIIGLSGGAAYAYFTSSGSGSGVATTGSMETVTIAAITSQTPNTALLPGSAGEVVVNVHNPNAFAVSLVSVVADGSISVSGGLGGCTVANSGVSFTSQNGLSVPIPATTTKLVRLAGAASMSSTSANGCQGATFSIPVTITVHTS
jgi:hypothetical protein